MVRLAWPSPHIIVTFVVRLSWPNPHIIVKFVVRLSWPSPQNTHASYVSRCFTFMLHPTAQIRMVWPSILDSCPHPPPHAQSKRKSSTCAVFVRWFGRPFWTHADVCPQIPGIHSKENWTCTAASQHEPANQWVDSIRLPE